MLSATALAHHLGLGDLLQVLAREAPYELLDHWQQGEFHHDVVVRSGDAVVVIATNCNGGVKEVLLLDEAPDRWALWHERCPDNPEFRSRALQPLPPVRDAARTPHWFDPCVLLADDARSELRPSCRRRAFGGGWEAV